MAYDGFVHRLRSHGIGEGDVEPLEMAFVE
jgi:hypothetical protein